MHLLLIAVTILMGAAVGWSIGANDAANSLGAAVGSKVLTLRRAIILITIFGFLGAFLQGGQVTKTIGKGIVPMDQLGKDLSLYLALVACFAACAWVVLATYWKMPISTSHSIVGAVAGAGLAMGAPIKWKVLTDIFICWFLTPLGAALLGFIFYQLFKNSLYRIIPRKFLRPGLAALIVISGCYVAFTWGANDVANSVGVISGAGILTPNISIVIGGAAIVLGIVTWGYKVIETVGSEITQLLPIMAFSAQLASAINVHIYTLFGIPVSTSHSIVGAIFGVGLVRGVRVLNVRIIREIVFCWLATPFISGIISFLVLKTIMIFVKIGG
ncbi:MAG: inorganic phosphate transporter family protein [Candidatus Omnitrophica bacterium]|nr:inorganic phosphate transporter family protein [Candidatus Omnitrophota bacterium]MBU1869665.1 inorganic phosphate transporter family protein [Candidatus Omnitrophota bacterium]